MNKLISAANLVCRHYSDSKKNKDLTSELQKMKLMIAANYSPKTEYSAEENIDLLVIKPRRNYREEARKTSCCHIM